MMNRTYILLSALFSVIVIFSNLISVKMVPFPLTAILVPAGLFFYPITYIVSNLVNERFGPKKARFMIYFALLGNLFTVGVLLFLKEHLAIWRIVSSIIAYLGAQLIDIQVYTFFRGQTGPRLLWLRNNGATWAAQLVDTLIIDMLFLYWAVGFSLDSIVPIMLVSYLYKIFFSMASTPFLYFFMRKSIG